MMATVRHLRNAPITEAVIDFRVVLPKEFRPEILRDAKSRLANEYSKSDEQEGFGGTIELRVGQATQNVRDIGFQGIWLKSEDEKTVAQFRINGFTLNRLKPYAGWDAFFEAAMRAWSVYVDLAKPQSVTRIALRYINHMPLPGVGAELNDFIHTAPRLPPSVPDVLSGFATRVVLEHPERRVSANVVQVLEVGMDSSATTLLLDIDAHKVGDFSVTKEVLAGILQDLRAYKNNIFFGSLTDRLLESFV